MLVTAHPSHRHPFPAGLAAVAIAVAIAVPLALPACGDPPPSKYPSQQVYVEDTTLGVGDEFLVRVFRQKDMTDTYVISAEGTISFPLIGVVEAAGKTPAQLETVLRDRLADGYLKNPQVSILVKEYKSKKVSILGQVQKPGTLFYTEGMTIIEAIAQAGGFTNMARKNAVTVTRVEAGQKTTYTLPVSSIEAGKAENFLIRPGDVVSVPRRVW